MQENQPHYLKPASFLKKYTKGITIFITALFFSTDIQYLVFFLKIRFLLKGLMLATFENNFKMLMS